MATLIRKFKVRQAVKGTKASLAKGYRKVASELQKDIKKIINRQTHPTKGPPSPPGKPPYKRTGTLRRSIDVKAPKDGSGVSVRSVKYGVFLEQGTGNMKARPFVSKAIQSNRAKYGKLLRDSVRKDQQKKAAKRKARRR